MRISSEIYFLQSADKDVKIPYLKREAGYEKENNTNSFLDFFSIRVYRFS